MTTAIDGLLKPSILKPLLLAGARHGLTALATGLVALGAISDSQTAQFVDLGLSLVTYAGTAAWVWWQENHGANKLVAAALTGDPSAKPVQMAITGVTAGGPALTVPVKGS